MAETSKNKACGTLYVVATPIGNLEDITLRAIKTLKEADLIAAEDTRHTRRLLTAHGIKGQLISYHEHNERQRTPELIDRLKEGTSIALVTDAGTPMVSDPGFRLVQAAVSETISIVPIPGVSAAIAALSAAGMCADSFTFVGFPARKKAKRIVQIKALAPLPHTLIFYQSPRRVVKFIAELGSILGDRQAVLAREVTKIHEEFIHGTLPDLENHLRKRTAIKGECTLLVAGAQNIVASAAELEAAIRSELSAARPKSLSEIARTLAKPFGVPRKAVYDQALKMYKDNE